MKYESINQTWGNSILKLVLMANSRIAYLKKGIGIDKFGIGIEKISG